MFLNTAFASTGATPGFLSAVVAQSEVLPKSGSGGRLSTSATVFFGAFRDLHSSASRILNLDRDRYSFVPRLREHFAELSSSTRHILVIPKRAPPDVYAGGVLAMPLGCWRCLNHGAALSPSSVLSFSLHLCMRWSS